MKQFFKNNKNDVWFWTFLFLTVVLFFAFPLLSRDAGNSGDEDGFQWPYGKQIYEYYATGGEDTTCLQNDDMGMHGGFFDQLTVAVVKVLHTEDYASVRHVMNSFFGWIGVLFAGLLAYKIAGWRASVFTVLLLFLSPRYLGHSFNNPKDLIYASMMMAGIYYVFCFIKEYPKPKIKTSILLSIFAALAIVSRFAGYLLFAYIVLFLIIYHFIQQKKKTFSTDSLKTVGRYIIFVSGIAIVTFLITIGLWPYIMETPVKTTMKIFHEMSSYGVSLRQLFEGTMQWSDYLPWYYTPKYILMTIPIAVIVGLVLFFVFCWRKREDRIWAFFVFFTFFFPVFWIVYTHANVYGGWRHAMFAYPPMVVAAGWGFEGLVQWLEKRLQVSGSKFQDPGEGRQQDAAKNWKPVLLNVSSVALVLVLLIGPIRHIVANHPYEYVYFNELVGGTKNQLGQYELDYYYHSTREASEWVLANAERKPDGSKVKVATWHTASVQYFFRKDTADFQVGFVRWYEQEYSDWDYAIFTVTGIAPEYLRSKYFPPKNTVKTIEVDGVPIAVVLKREDRNAYYASQVSKDASKLDSAIMLYGRALSYDPNNLCALQGMGESYLRTGRPDSALYYLDRYHAIDPEAETSNYLRAYSYVYKNDAKSSLAILHQLEKQNPKYSASYALAVQLYLQMKDYPSAKKEFDRAIENERMDDQMVRLWLQYNAAQNIDEQHAYISLYKKMAKSYEKKGKKKEAEQYRNLIGMK